MKNTKIQNWCTLIVLCLTILSCNKKQDFIPSIGNKDVNNSDVQMTKLLRKLENPYSVANMQKAYDNLVKSNKRVSNEGIKVSTTHLYIKFKPKNNQELEILKDDTTLILYSYPLDYDISQGSTYHDPSIADSLPAYQYCSVPIEQKLPTSIEYEVLENLYIPDEEKDGIKSSQRTVSPDAINALVNESLRITGNLDSKDTNNNRYSRSSCWLCAPPSWRPAGIITVWDEINSKNIGVEGVIVRARRWFTTHEGMVDANGNYSCNGTFRYEATYSIEWERYDFALREGWLDGANINEPNKKGNWDKNFKGDKHAFHAKVFMGAYYYYYKDIKGLRRPPQNGILKTQMRIRCYYENNPLAEANHKEERRFLGLGSQIKIFNPQNRIDRLFATTIHELAHASHWNMWRKGEDFDNSDKIVKESWAKGVEWILTKDVWKSYSIDYYRRKNLNHENEPEYYNYTGVVQDMIDSDFSGGDQINGYSIREVEDALQGQKTWNDWKENIKTKYNNVTENSLDNLFNYWN